MSAAARGRPGPCDHVTDDGPGIRRARRGEAFCYFAPSGRPIRDPRVLARIASLAIPPAWERVWICPSARGHIQATGRDARGRKQYRYHPKFREHRDATKFHRMVAFASALPRLRGAVDDALSKAKLDRDKVLAAIVRLLELTLIRIGNEEYARANDSYGLTTLRPRHVDLDGSTLRFHFRGKSGKPRDLGVRDRRVARVVARCNELPGELLFQWVDEAGALHAIESSDVNAWIRERIGGRFSAKDIRTWAGTVLLGRALSDLEPAVGAEPLSLTARRKALRGAVASVAEALGNTAAVCLRCYVHPVVPATWLDGGWPRRAVRGAPDSGGLRGDEAAILRLVAAAERRLRADRRSSASPRRGSTGSPPRLGRGPRGSSGSRERPRPRAASGRHSQTAHP